MPAAAPELLTFNAASRLLGVSLCRVRKLVNAGFLTPLRFEAYRYPRLRKEDVEISRSLRKLRLSRRDCGSTPPPIEDSATRLAMLAPVLGLSQEWIDDYLLMFPARIECRSCGIAYPADEDYFENVSSDRPRCCGCRQRRAGPSIQRRQAFKPGADTLHFMEMLRRDPCSYCGASSQIDHIAPVSQGGAMDWSNLTAACAACNHKKRTRPMLAFFAEHLRRHMRLSAAESAGANWN